MTRSFILPASGAFAATKSSLRGNFHGDSLEGVGGILDKDGVTGAFGAKRQ